MRRLAGAIAALFAVLLLAASPASAHATLVSSDPANGSVVASAPQTIRLVFDESVSVQPDAIDVYGPGGVVVPTSAKAEDRTIVATPGSSLGRGTYVVSWHASSDDGHPETGILTFSVGEPSAEVPQLPPGSSSRVGPLGLLQGLMFLGLLVTVGLIWFGSWTLADRGAVERLPDLLLAVGAITVFSAVTWVPTTVAYQAGAPVSAGWQLALSSWGSHPAELQSMGLIVGGVVLGVLAFVRGWRLVATAAGLAAVAGPAVFGHTRAEDPVWLAIPADVAHVAAGAAWLGGIVGLLLAWRRLDPEQQRLTLHRFSQVATGALALVVLTGSFAAWRILGSWGAWVHTDYGRVLLVKIALVAVVVALAARGRLRGRDPSFATVAWEAGTLVAVVAVASFLTEADPNPPQSTAVADVRTVQLGAVRASVRLDPSATGRNIVTVVLRDGAGRAVDPTSPPVLVLRGPEFDPGQVPVERLSSGRYRAVVLLPDPGRWLVQLRVRPPDADPVTRRVAFLVTGTPTE